MNAPIPIEDHLVGTGEIPRDYDSERAVLAAILQDPVQYLPKAIDLRGKFYAPPHNRLFDAILEISEGLADSSCEAVVARLRIRGDLEKVGGDGAVYDLLHEPGATIFDWSAEQVRATDRARKLLLTFADFRSKICQVRDYTEGMPKLIEEAQAAILEFPTGRKTSEPATWNETLAASIEQIEENRKLGGRIPGIETGFPILDEHTRGLCPGTYWVIAGRPGKGKTSLGMNIAENVGDREPVLFFSAEMSKEELGIRSLARASGIENIRLASGAMRNDGEWKRFLEAAKAHSRKKIFVNDTSDLSVPAIRTISRRYVRKHGVKVICIDYLQLLESGDRARSREEEVSRMSRHFKSMARELGVCVIVLAQLNRESDKAGRRPRKSDLRESGAIEQDADVVLLLHHKDSEPYEDPTVIPTHIDCEIIVDKARNGREGIVPVTYNKGTTTFEPEG